MRLEIHDSVAMTLSIASCAGDSNRVCWMRSESVNAGRAGEPVLRRGGARVSRRQAVGSPGARRPAQRRAGLRPGAVDLGTGRVATGCALGAAARRAGRARAA